MLDLALTAQILLWLIVLGIFLASGQASLFHPLTFYLAFHLLVFIVRPLQILFLDFDFGWNYIHFEPTEDDLLKTFTVTSVSLVIFAITTLVAGRTRVAYSAASPEPFTPVQKQGLLWATLILGPLILFSIYRANSGGFQGEQRGHIFVMTGDSGYVVEAQFMAGPLICIWMMATRFSWRGLGPLILYIAYRSYTGWMRWTIVLFVFALAMTYAWQQRKRWLPLTAILALIPVLIVFQVLGRNRANFRHLLAGEQIQWAAGEIDSSIPASEKLKLKSDGPDYANFDFLTFILAIVPARTQSFTYGSQYLQIFTEPIPRKLWPGKPLGAPIGFFDLNNYGNFQGMTPTILGDGWMSGGWLGLVITLTLVGWLLGLAHRWFWRNSNDNIIVLFYIAGLAMLPQWFRDGGISIAKFLFWNLSPLFVWLFCVWLAGGKRMPASIILPPGAKVRFIQAQARNGN